MKMLRKIADERIREAMQRGEFDDLAGHGKPLDLDDDSLVPVELRLANRILKNAGYLPEEVRLRADIRALERSIGEAEDDETKLPAMRRLQMLHFRLDAGREGGRPLHLDDAYHRRILDKLGPKPG